MLTFRHIYRFLPRTKCCYHYVSSVCVSTQQRSLHTKFTMRTSNSGDGDVLRSTNPQSKSNMKTLPCPSPTHIPTPYHHQPWAFSGFPVRNYSKWELCITESLTLETKQWLMMNGRKATELHSHPPHPLPFDEDTSDCRVYVCM